MPGNDPRETPTLPSTTHVTARERRDRLRLVVLRDDTFQAHTLPETGSVTIGRVPENTVCIDNPGVSRRHAVLSVGPPVTLEDLGSQNGTSVRGVRIEARRPVELAPGDVFEVGPVTVVLQGVSRLSRPRRLWSHSYFEGRLEEECARAERIARPFAILRLHIDGDPAQDTVEATLSQLLRAEDLIAHYGPGEFEVMLQGASPAEAEAADGEMRTRLAERGIRSQSGLACFPRDGRSPEALVARACSAVRGAEPSAPDVGPIVVEDPAMQRLHALLAKVAVAPIPVLLLGETGVGKEVLADRLHRLSPRADKPFLGLNCGALSESLLESELFGHERGAFTGAVKAKPGLLESAEGGTVFLDEIGEMAPSAQVKLLRVLEEKRVLRVGGLKPTSIDVRFVAATNRDLEAAAAAGEFRQDLYFRLCGVSLVVPPLRERPSEIEALARHFLAQAAQMLGRRSPPALSGEALAVLRGYGWPGNIRELRNIIERAVLLCAEGLVLPEHLPLDKMSAKLTARFSPPEAAPRASRQALRAETDDLEKQRIVEALQKSGGNQRKAAEMLQMPRRTFVRRLEEYGLPRPRKGDLDGDE